jgi:hypothetical protein
MPGARRRTASAVQKSAVLVQPAALSAVNADARARSSFLSAKAMSELT